MKVRYTPRARADREKIFDYLVARNPQAARKVVGLITQRVNDLGDNPQLGHRTNRPGVHTLWVAPYPHRIFYRIDGDEVVMVQIRHTSRRPR